MRRRRMHIGYWCESHKEIDHQEDQNIGGWIILRWILERKYGLVWTRLVWLRIGTSGRLL
jgi:hypothetical protein